MHAGEDLLMVDSVDPRERPDDGWLGVGNDLRDPDEAYLPRCRQRGIIQPEEAFGLSLRRF